MKHSSLVVDQSKSAELPYLPMPDWSYEQKSGCVPAMTEEFGRGVVGLYRSKLFGSDILSRQAAAARKTGADASASKFMSAMCTPVSEPLAHKPYLTH